MSGRSRAPSLVRRSRGCQAAGTTRSRPCRCHRSCVSQDTSSELVSTGNSPVSRHRLTYPASSPTPHGIMHAVVRVMQVDRSEMQETQTPS